MKAQFIPKSKLNGILCDEIEDAYFPLRKNNRLTLYQDADTLPSPRVTKDSIMDILSFDYTVYLNNKKEN